MKRLGCTIAGLLVVLFLGASITTGIPGSNYLRSKKISAAIAQRFPLGSSKSQVLMFLKKEKIEHDFIGKNSGFGFGSVVRDAGLQDSQLGGIAVSIVRQTSWGFLYVGDTQFVFFFNKKNKLIRILEMEIATGF